MIGVIYVGLSALVLLVFFDYMVQVEADLEGADREAARVLGKREGGAQ